MWQSRDYKDFMHGLDKIWKMNRRSKGGNLPRKRIELADPTWVDSEAPPGLWRNCYDDEWLRKQPHQKRIELRIINEEYDFSLDPRVQDDA